MNVKDINIAETSEARELINATEGHLTHELTTFDILAAVQVVQKKMQTLPPAAQAKVRKLLAQI